jgi:hypothetical protein
MKTIFVLLLSVVSWAQTSSSVLFGDVRDSSGGLVQGVSIVATEVGTGFTRSIRSGSLGEYRMEDLRPGTYSIQASLRGFRNLTIGSVVLEVSQKLQLDLNLVPGHEYDEVTVTAEASLLQTGDASEGVLLQAATVQALPLVGRNIGNLVTVGPGAIPRQLGGFGHDIVNDLQGNRGAVALNPPVNGARSTMNVNVLDGAYNTDRNTFAIVITPPMESVQEFRIQTSLAPAQAAQAGGAVIDVITKSGTKNFHGSAFEFLRNEATDALGIFADPSLPKAVFRQNQFGGSLGGPLKVLPSTFFYGTYEGLRNRSAQSKLHLVPDSVIRQGDFAASNPLFDPLNVDGSGARRPFAGNRIPVNRIDPIATKFLNTYQPLPNRNTAGGGPNYLDSTPSTDDANSGLSRIDHQFRGQGWLFARYTINNQTTYAAGFFPQLPTLEKLRAQQGVIGYTSGFGRWVNEARLSFTRLSVLDVPVSAFQTNVQKELGMVTDSDEPLLYGLPFFVISNFETVTDSPTLPQVQRDNLWNVTDGLSITRGRHTFQAGFQWIHFQLNYLQSQFPRGQYLFTGAFTANLANPSNTGDPFGDFLLGFPQTTRRFAGLAQAYMRQDSVAGYVQDDYRIRPNLTLNFGLRYEYISPYSEKRNNMFNLDYSTLPQAPVLKRVSNAVAPDRNNFAPRIGVAWRLPGFVFRGGYGIYYQPEIAVESYDLVRNGLRNEINQTSGVNPLLTTRNGFPQGGTLGLPTYFGIDPKARTPYVQQWSAGLQRLVGGGILVEGSYVGTKGTKLGRFRTFNTPAHVETGENLGPRPGELQSLRTFPQFGPLIQRQHISNSNFHSLQLKAEKRFRKGLSFLTSFVWSKSIDDADTVIPGQYDSFGAQDERNLRLERGTSFFDVRRRFSAGYFYQLPRAHFWAPVFSNWQTSGIVTIQDGTPLNPVYFGLDLANSGTPNRPNVVAGQNVRLSSSERSIDQFFNRSAFSDPAPFTFGNAGRNILPGPPNNIFDVAVHRRFPIGEKMAFQLRVEAFNVFNHPNLGIPGPYPDFGPFFGKVFAAGEQRRMQFGLRFDF